MGLKFDESFAKIQDFCKNPRFSLKSEIFEKNNSIFFQVRDHPAPILHILTPFCFCRTSGHAPPSKYAELAPGGPSLEKKWNCLRKSRIFAKISDFRENLGFRRKSLLQAKLHTNETPQCNPYDDHFKF